MRGVQTGPGAMTLHLIFLAASSVATPLVKVMMAPCNQSKVFIIWTLNLPCTSLDCQTSEH